MASNIKTKVTLRPKTKKKPAAMTKKAMVEKMLADQKFIREAIQKGISFKELSVKYSFTFATV